MTINVTMPQMGESVYEGTLTKWLKKVGDTVERDEPLFEVSTDKVDSEIPSPASGILSEILIPEGQTIQINTTLAIIAEAGAGEKQTGSAASQLHAEEQPEDSASGEDHPEEPAMQPPSPKTARDETVSEVRVDAMPAAPELPSPDIKPAEKTAPGIRIQAIRTSPLVRKIARENKIDLSDVTGTGLEGRITKEDILKYIDRRKTPQDAEPPPHEISESAPADKTEKEADKMPSSISEFEPKFAGETETVPMTPMRRAIAEHMIFSKRTSAHVNTVFEVDLHSIVNLRQRVKEEFEKREGVALTYTPFFAKALVDTVRDYPIFNASLSGDNIIYKKPVNLGIAVALESGLIVPVIKNAQLKNLTGIALRIADLADRARTKRLKPEEVQDGTISMTNPGRFGALFATPVISQPQVAILGIGGIEKRPVVIHDAIAIRPMVCLSLTFDHRVIDGAVADQFMALLKEKLQSWTQWPD